MGRIFGWDYPAGAENDPRAPWNQPEPICDQCGCDEEDCECDPDEIEGQREAALEDKADAMRERRDIERLERENDEN